MLLPDEKLKELILKTNLIAVKEFEKIAQFALNSHISLSDALLDKDVVTDENLGLLIADSLKIPFITLSKIAIAPEVFRIIPEKTARIHKVIPFARDQNGIKLAMIDPTDKEIIEMIEKKTGQKVVPHLSTEKDIYNTLRIYRSDMQKAINDLLKTDSSHVSKAQLQKDAPITKILDVLINYAYQDKSSDIHIEPEEKNSLVRFRIDGILYDVLYLPKNLHDQIITRIKVLSRLRTDEHLAPQDGKMRVKLDEEDLDIRISILPIAEGEKVVMRLLSSRFRQFSLLDLGMNEKDLEKVTNAFTKSYGMILSTGPTGSGKTTSIYAILKIINSREKNITTIEDPIEYRIKGVNQIQVNPKTNLTFASGLRSILRQDPNIIFVGEIRDSETAGIAVNAALTGHLVLSTLHTNDAATALPRLTDMKVEPFLVASTVNVIIAQRLVRKICEMCKVSVNTTIDDLQKRLSLQSLIKQFGKKREITIYQGQGCKVCNGSGYSGRIGIFEVLVVSSTMKDLIVKKNDSDVIAKKAIEEGMTTMQDDGLEKVAKGLTTLEEVLRVTKVESL